MSLLVLTVTPTSGDAKIDVTYSPTNIVGATTYRVTLTEQFATTAIATDTKSAGDPNVGKASFAGLVNGRTYVIEALALSGTTLLAKGVATAQPTMPLTVTVTAGDRQLQVDYTVASHVAGASSVRVEVTAPVELTLTGTVPTGNVTFTSLANDTEHTVKVTVLNSSSTALATLERKATPRSPLVVSATGGDATLDVTWTLTTAVSNISSYRVTLTPGSAQQTVAATTTTVSFPGLQNGTQYTALVEALTSTSTLITSSTAKATPSSPIKVTAVPGDKKITVVYAVVAPLTGVPSSFEVSTQPVTTTVTRQLTDAPSVVLAGLTNGTTYTVFVRARDAGNNVLATGSATATPAGVIGLELPPLTLHPLTVADLDVARTRRALLEAARIGGKWRYDFLKQQVFGAIDNAAVLEQELQRLMSLDLAKNAAAQEVLPAYLLKLTSDLSALAAKAQKVPIPDIDDSVRGLADAINTLALLERLLDWLATHSALKFWIGLFERVIDDLAAFDTGLTRTRRYLRETFGQSDIKAAIMAMAADAQGQIFGYLDDTAAPLRAGVGEAISIAAGALQSVFDAFDEPLLVNVGSQATGAVTAPNPLDTLSAQLVASVEDVIRRIREEVQRALDLAVNPAAAAALFELIIVTYVLLPILAALAVGIAGGPISAAVFAAAVTLAAQELLHLLARWLSGPLREQLSLARGKVEEALAVVRDALATPLADLLGAATTTDPGLDLGWAAGQLGSLRDLLPDVYLHRAAALLEDARDAVLDSAVGFALAAEQALGFENATVFDEIARKYADRSGLPAVPRLPGGLGSGPFATAALVRDVSELEHRRVELLDGKEIELTLRLSLFRELGGEGDPGAPAATGFVAGELGRLLRGEEVALELREEVLLDRGYPGWYRALISEIRARAVFQAPLPAALSDVNFPLHLLHLGPSRTRVRVGSRRRAIREQQKWSYGTYLAPDRDPQIGALGFATLVRELPAEAVTLNMIFESVRPGATQMASGALPPTTLPSTRDAQYRPFENRGLEGTFLLNLPAAETLTALGDSTRLFGGLTGPRLLDIVVDLRVRACYDADLAAELRARRRETATVLRRASPLLATNAVLQLAGGGVTRATPSDRRTVHFSLRAHRDNVLRFWQGVIAERAALNQPQLSGGAVWADVPKTEPLALGHAFKPLPTEVPAGATSALPRFSLRFAAAAAPNMANAADLANVASEIVVTPDMLGVTTDMLAQTPPGAGIVGVGVAVVPTTAGATLLTTVPVTNPTPWGTGAARDAAIANVDGELAASVIGGSSSGIYLAEQRSGVWQPFAAGASAPNSPDRIALAQSGRQLHAATLDANGNAYHAVREATWTAWGLLTQGSTQPPSLRAIAMTDVAGAAHACAVDKNTLVVRHTLRGSTGWSVWGDVFASTGRHLVYGWFIFAALEVAAVDRDGELYTFATVLARYGSSTYAPAICYTLRSRDGTWRPWRLLALGGALGVGIGAARIARDVHVCWAGLNGAVSHVAIGPSGAKTALTSVTTILGKPQNADVRRVACAAQGQDLVLVAVTSTGRVYTTRRRPTGAWDPWLELDVLAGVELGKPDDPLATVTLLAGGALGTVLPTFKTATNPGRLRISDAAPGPAPAVSLKDLFANTASRLELNIDTAVQNGLIYDVILSITYALPVQTVTPSA